MHNWKNLFYNVAWIVFLSSTAANAQSESRQQTSEETTVLPLPNDKPSTEKLSVEKEGFFRPGILLQAWFLAQRAEKATTTFRLRRAELHVKGEMVLGWVSYSVMVDLAKLMEFKDTTVAVKTQNPTDLPGSVTVKQPIGAVSMLQDFFITVKSPYMDISLGQFKTPVSLEGYNSSSRLLFPERALVSREFGDRRDLGIRLAKNFKYFGYSAGVFNGAGQNVLDVDNAKDVALRLEAYPVEGLVLAGVAYMTIGGRNANVRDRYEADVRFEQGPFLFQAEYIRARDKKNSALVVDGQGFYGALAWTFLDVLQACFRIGYIEPNIRVKPESETSEGKGSVWQIDVGLNYYVKKHEMKFQLSYSRLQYRTLQSTNELILAGQVAF